MPSRAVGVDVPPRMPLFRAAVGVLIAQSLRSFVQVVDVLAVRTQVRGARLACVYRKLTR